jgi:hypothetical protein
MVLPLPVMNTALKSPSAISLAFNSASSGRLHQGERMRGEKWAFQDVRHTISAHATHLSNAGCSKSFTHISCRKGWLDMDASKSLGSAELRRLRSKDLKILGVASPTGGLTYIQYML